MNGAESLLRTLSSAGTTVCFANPGTSEMHIVEAFDRVPEMRAVLGLFEGVVTGAADGYARIQKKPAATLLHLGPGLANGLANLHNAKRATSPVVNIVGAHATSHAQYDTVLTSDIEGFARPVSAWVRTSKGAAFIAADTAEAVREASSPPGQIATLIVPADAAWSECSGSSPALTPRAARQVSEGALAEAEKILKGGGKTALLLRGNTLGRSALDTAGRIAARTGCRLLCETFAPMMERGAGVVAIERIPYFAEDMAAFLQDLDALIFVGAAPPTTVFAYPGKSGWVLPERCALSLLAAPDEDGVAALHVLAERLQAKVAPVAPVLAFGPEPDGAASLTSAVVGLCIARHLPEGVIVSDDAATSGGAVFAALANSHPHTWLRLTGGAIGQGLPVAIGAAFAAPGQKVLCLLGDGSGLYTAQALWTIAREQLDVATIVFTNRSYKILEIEFARMGLKAPGPKAQSMVSLNNPEISWSKLALSFGVSGHETRTAAEFSRHFEEAMRMRGPVLIEAITA